MSTVTQEQLERFYVNLGKGRDSRRYLTVAGRVWWFRQEHPDWGIVTAPVEIDMEKGHAIFTASIFDAEGRVIATATKCETARGFPDFIEKANTGAVGRALILAGFGADAAGYDLDEGDRLADSPQLPAQQPNATYSLSPAARLIAAKAAFGEEARAAGFDMLGESGNLSRTKVASLLSDIALWGEWSLPLGYAENPDVWQKAAGMVKGFAAAQGVGASG